MRAGMQELLGAYTGTLDLLDSHARVRLEKLGKAHSGYYRVYQISQASTRSIDITRTQVDQ